ncbi:SRPBCC domain-containing protein [Kribbella sp. NPDC048915]|uniref:SRPBCC family protein n=1 Tax=Kribbella sp. NPDC048915 TaxID=3155148 RepID=UPI0033CEE93D
MARISQDRKASRTARAPQLRYIRTLECDADRLWKLITQPELVSTWLGPTTLSDTQYGGFTIATGAHTQHTGLITTCSPPHYFQLAFHHPPHHPSTVLVDVVPSDHASHLILTHGGLPRDLLPVYDRLWTESLTRLERTAAGGLRALRS